MELRCCVLNLARSNFPGQVVYQGCLSIADLPQASITGKFAFTEQQDSTALPSTGYQLAYPASQALAWQW